MSSLQDFLNFLWEDTHGFVNLSIKASDGSWSRSFAEWPRQRESVKSFIETRTAQGSEVFMGPAMWKEKPPAGQQYGKELFLGSHVLWAEFDGNAPETWDQSTNNVPRVEQPVAPTVTPATGPDASTGQPGGTAGPPSVSNGPEGAARSIQPSWINQTSSSQNQHTYWKLNQFLTDPDILENLNRTIATEHGADNCWDVTRVLRPPETTNYGIGKPDRNGKTYPVRVEEANDRRYPVQSFRQTPDFRPVIREAMADVPDIRKVLAQHQWDEEFYRTFTEEPPYKKRSDALQFLAYAAAESGFSNEEIYSVLRDADDRWEKYTGRLDRDKWLIDHVERARAKYPLGEETLTFEGLLRSNKAKGTEDSATAIPDKLIYNLNEFMELDVKVEWLLQGLIPRGGYGIIAGPNGIGKSQMGLRLCESMVTSTKFLGQWECVKPDARVMFLSLEMVHVELKEVLSSMKEYGEFFRTGSDRCLIVPIGSAIPLDKPEGFKFIENLLKTHSPDLLLIDSLSLAMSGDFKDDKPVLEFNRVIRRLTVEFGVAIIVIHHNRKGQDKKYRYNELDDLYGSRFLSQDASFVLMIDKPKSLPPDTISINPAKLRFIKSTGELHAEHKNMNFVNVIDPDGTLPNFEHRSEPKPPNAGSNFG